MLKKVSLLLVPALLLTSGLCLAALKGGGESLETPVSVVRYVEAYGCYKADWSRQGLSFYIGSSERGGTTLGFVDSVTNCGYFVDFDEKERSAQVNYTRDSKSRGEPVKLPKGRLESVGKGAPLPSLVYAREWKKDGISFGFTQLNGGDVGYIFEDERAGCQYIVQYNAQSGKARAFIERPKRR